MLHIKYQQPKIFRQDTQEQPVSDVQIVKLFSRLLILLPKIHWIVLQLYQHLSHHHQIQLFPMLVEEQLQMSHLLIPSSKVHLLIVQSLVVNCKPPPLVQVHLLQQLTLMVNLQFQDFKQLQLTMCQLDMLSQFVLSAQMDPQLLPQ